MLPIFIMALVGAVISAILGTIWYSNSTPMGKLHMRYLGFDKLSAEEQKRQMEEAKPKMAKMYGAQIVLSVLTSFAVALIVIMSLQNGLTFGMALSFVLLNWLCFIVPTIGTALLWSNCDRAIVWKKFFSDIGYNLVNLVIVAFVASLLA